MRIALLLFFTLFITACTTSEEDTLLHVEGGNFIEEPTHITGGVIFTSLNVDGGYDYHVIKSFVVQDSKCFYTPDIATPPCRVKVRQINTTFDEYYYMGEPTFIGEYVYQDCDYEKDSEKVLECSNVLTLEPSVQ